MSVDQEILEQIDQYLEGTLSKQSLKTFEGRLKTDASFKELVEEQQLIIRSIKKKKLMELKKKLSSFHEDMEVDEPSKVAKQTKEAIIRPLNSKRPLGRWLSVAASLLLLVGSYFFFLQNPVIPDSTIAQNEQPSEELVATPGQYVKVPIQDKAGVVQKDINLLVTPSVEKVLKYTLQEDLVVLFIDKERIPNLEQRLFYDEQRPGIYFIKFEENYYLLKETVTPTIAEQAIF